MTRTVTTIFLLVEILLALTGLVFVLNLAPLGDLVEMASWVVTAMIYLLAGGIAIWLSATRADRRVAAGEDDDGDDHESHWPIALTGTMPYITSLVGVTAAFVSSSVKAAPEIDSPVRLAYNVLAAMAMIAAWAILQVGMARQYERAWHREGGLDFPGTARPRFADFTYFSFTLGAAFATSDVKVATRRMRMRVLLHTVWSFLYNAAIVAMAISILTGR